MEIKLLREPNIVNEAAMLLYNSRNGESCSELKNAIIKKFSIDADVLDNCFNAIIEISDYVIGSLNADEKLLDFLASELQQPEERADESVSIAAYLKKHFQEDVSLDSVSHALSMSVSSVRRTLQRETGETFQQVLVALRMERASMLLKEKTLSINEVAFVCGFHDALYFRRAFKKRFGLTPSEYRARAAAE